MALPDIDDVIARLDAAKETRRRLEADWRMAAAYCLPRHYSRWYTEAKDVIGQHDQSAVRRWAFDSTGVRALPKFVAILERISTPHTQRWHILRASNPELNKIRRVRVFFDALGDAMFGYRYAPSARFIQSASQMYQSLGAYGTGPMYIDPVRQSATEPAGFSYRTLFLGSCYVIPDDRGRIVTTFRTFTLSARQFLQKWPELKGQEPRSVKAELAKPRPDDNKRFEFAHLVTVRTDYDPGSYTATKYPYLSCYLCLDDREYVGGEQGEAGYVSLPYITAALHSEAEMAYGYSPAMQALPALGTLNAVKKTGLKASQKAADPTYLTHDDGTLSGLDIRPGAVNPGGVDKEGRMLVRRLESGDFRYADRIIEMEREDVNDAFMVNLFQILTESPEMTATQVMENVAEKASLLSPTMGFTQSEFLAPTIGREIDMLAELGRLPEVPPEIMEEGGNYDIVYTSPLSKGRYAEQISGFMRAFEFALNYAKMTGDQAPLDQFKLDEALPEMADYMGAPVRWMASPDDVKAVREDRKQAEQNAALMQNAGNLAAAAKVATEIGQGNGGTR